MSRLSVFIAFLLLLCIISLAIYILYFQIRARQLGIPEPEIWPKQISRLFFWRRWTNKDNTGSSRMYGGYAYEPSRNRNGYYDANGGSGWIRNSRNDYSQHMENDEAWNVHLSDEEEHDITSKKQSSTRSYQGESEIDEMYDDVKKRNNPFDDSQQIA